MAVETGFKDAQARRLAQLPINQPNEQVVAAEFLAVFVRALLIDKLLKDPVLHGFQDLLEVA